MVVLLVITIGGVYIGAAVIARHRAQAAADLAALAAASRLVRGAEAACAHASSVATAMHASVVDCNVAELDVVVSVNVNVARSDDEAARQAAGEDLTVQTFDDEAAAEFAAGQAEAGSAAADAYEAEA